MGFCPQASDDRGYTSKNLRGLCSHSGIYSFIINYDANPCFVFVIMIGIELDQTTLDEVIFRKGKLHLPIKNLKLPSGLEFKYKSATKKEWVAKNCKNEVYAYISGIGGIGDTVFVKEDYAWSPEGFIYRSCERVAGIKWRSAKSMSHKAARLFLQINDLEIKQRKNVNIYDLIVSFFKIHK